MAVFSSRVSKSFVRGGGSGAEEEEAMRREDYLSLGFSFFFALREIERERKKSPVMLFMSPLRTKIVDLSCG